jgi:hypothetical protein
MVERRTVDAVVAGSNPVIRPKQKTPVYSTGVFTLCLEWKNPSHELPG